MNSRKPFDPAALTLPELAGLTPYHANPGEYAIRLDANESPFPLPPELAKEVARATGGAALNRYPDPRSRGLKKAWAALLACPEDRLAIGNGSDELITLLYTAFRRPPAGGKPVTLLPAPSFAMYALSGTAAGFGIETVPLTLPDLTLDLQAFLAAVRSLRPNLVFLAQPNNPTGTLHPGGVVEAILRAAPGLVVVDEAYGDFAGEPSWAARLPEFPNLVVLRTLSKVGGAALRCGLLAANLSVLREVEKVRGPFNVNALTQAAGEVLLRHPEWIVAQVRKIVAGREALAKGLKDEGFTLFPSRANFLLTTFGGREKALADHLAGAGIVVKSFSRLPVVGDALRITVGTPEENRALLERIGTFEK